MFRSATADLELAVSAGSVRESAAAAAHHRDFAQRTGFQLLLYAHVLAEEAHHMADHHGDTGILAGFGHGPGVFIGTGDGFLAEHMQFVLCGRFHAHAVQASGQGDEGNIDIVAGEGFLHIGGHLAPDIGGKLAGAITHTGASGNNFVGCSGTS